MERLLGLVWSEVTGTTGQEGNWEGMGGNAQNTQRAIAVTQERSADALPWLWQWVFKAGTEIDGFKYILEVESIAFS